MMNKNEIVLNKTGAECTATGRDGPDLKRGVKRYNLALPKELYGELQCLAETEHTTILDLIRRFIKLGLIAVEIEKDPEAKLVIHEGDRQRELAFLV